MSSTDVWNDVAGGLTRGCPNPGVTPPVPPDPTVRFGGDVGVGKIRLGATSGTQRSVEEFDLVVFGGAAGARRHSTTRDYNNDGTDMGRAKFRLTSGSLAQLRTWTGQGRMPMFSFKAMETVAGVYRRIPCAKILDGSYNADLDFTFTQLETLPGPVFGSFWHEPEDDYPMNPPAGQDGADDYRAAYQYILARYAAGGYTRIVWCSPWFMNFTFMSGSGRDFRRWHPNWNGTAWISPPLVKVDAVDIYNPQAGISAGAHNLTWAQLAGRFLNARAAAGAPALPWIIGELGVENYYPSLAELGVTIPQVLLDMVNVGAASQGLAAVCLWNNDHFAFTPAQDPALAKTNGWKAAVALSNVVLS